jgi:hypothetical protein
MGALGNAQLGLMSNGSHAFTVPGDANAAALAALQVQVAKIMSILATLSGQIVALGGSVATTYPAALAAAPDSTMSLTFDYLPQRDGLALRTGGPTLAGYQAATSGIWEPRFGPWGTDPHGGSDTYSGCYGLCADPAFAWSNGFTPFSLNANGDLVITASLASTLGFGTGELPTNSATGSPYTWVTGVMSSRSSFAQCGGYWEIVAQPPVGKGTWPSIWLIPYDNVHPGEIDINETIWDQDGTQTYRATVIPATGSANQTHEAVGITLSAGLHRYGVDWTDTHIAFYFDGALLTTISTTSNPEFGRKYYLLMALQIGSNLSLWVNPPDGTTPTPLPMVIHRVSVYQHIGPISLDLGATAYFDNLAVGGTVGPITVGLYGTATLTGVTDLTDPDSMFAVSGGNLVLAQSVPASTKATHAVTLQATGSNGRTYQRLFNINVLVALTNQANYITSSDLTNGSVWSLQNVTASSADTVHETSANSTHIVANASLIARTAAAKTFIRYVEATPIGADTWLMLQVTDSTYANSVIAWFDVANKRLGFSSTAGSWSGLLPFVMAVPGTSRVRCGMEFTTDASTTGFQVIHHLATGQYTDTYAGVTANGMQLDNQALYNPAAGAGGY